MKRAARHHATAQPKGPVLGQHFLSDPVALQSIADAAQLTTQDFVLEIGPGSGTLTTVLAQAAGRVLAIEKDETLWPTLENLRQQHKNVDVVLGDVRRIDVQRMIQEVFGEHPFKVVANIPYYLTNFLIQQLLQLQPLPEMLVLLVQKEVGERLAAQPGEYSVLGLSVQMHCFVEGIFAVPRNLFTPVPAVDSVVIRLTPLARPAVPKALQSQFMTLVKHGFAQRRKTLANNLAGVYRVPKDTIERHLTALALSPMARAQELSIAQWLQLLQKLTK